MIRNVSIIYITGRREPRFRWFVESLLAQTTHEQRAYLQIVFIDGHLWHKDTKRDPRFDEISIKNPYHHDVERLNALAEVVAYRLNYLHIPPKPSAHQGPFRQTTKDFFAAGSARNTGVIVAEHDYLVYVDDLSVIGPQWFNQIQHAAKDEYCVCGMYKKLKKMEVVDGKLVSFEEFPGGIDSRWSQGSDGGVVPWHGSGMFGCSFGVPLEAMLEVDGNDGAAITQGGEDYDLGIRLERAGWPFYLNRNLFTAESEEDHHLDITLPRIRRIVTPDRLPKNYDSYQIVRQDERYWSDHVILNRLANETERVLPLIGDDLRVLRAWYQETGMVPIPKDGQLDWRDGTPLSEL